MEHLKQETAVPPQSRTREPDTAREIASQKKTTIANSNSQHKKKFLSETDDCRHTQSLSPEGKSSPTTRSEGEGARRGKEIPITGEKDMPPRNGEASTPNGDMKISTTRNGDFPYTGGYSPRQQTEGAHSSFMFDSLRREPTNRSDVSYR